MRLLACLLVPTAKMWLLLACMLVPTTRGGHASCRSCVPGTHISKAESRIRRNCGPLWRAIADKTESAERTLVFLPASGFGDMALSWITATHLALRYSLRLRVLHHRKFNGVGHYLRHRSAAGAPLVLNATELPVPLIKVTDASQGSWKRGAPVTYLQEGVAHVNLVNSGMRWTGDNKTVFRSVMREKRWIFLHAGNANIYQLKANGMFDWHDDGRLRDEAVSHEYDHCVLRYAMNVQPRIAETLPPKAADVLIGIHVRSVRFLKNLASAASTTNASLASKWDDNYHLDVAWKMADFARFAEDARRLEPRDGRSSKWFVLSDSPSLLALLQRAWRDRVVAWTSNPVHVMNHSAGDLSSQYRDWLMLGRCDHVVCSGSQYSTSARLYAGTAGSALSYAHAYGGGGHVASLVNAVVVDTSVDIIKVDQASAFAVGAHTYEVSLLQGEAVCRDGSAPRWHFGDFESDERPQQGWRTHVMRCGAAPPAPAPKKAWKAAVCHPFLEPHPGARRPPESVVRRWVDYYLSRGFDRVCFYVHDRSLIYDGIEGTTWFVLDWLRDKGVHYGGQVTAINHCLYWHKERGTSYVLFGDVDEYVVETPRPARVHDLVEYALAASGADARRVASFDFGEYRVTSLAAHGTFVERLRFNATDETAGYRTGWMGHRKTLARVNGVVAAGIHGVTNERGLETHHFPPREMAILHARGHVHRPMGDERIVYVLPAGGRLGNALSTYAACYALALRTNTTVAVPRRNGACVHLAWLPGCGVGTPGHGGLANPLPDEPSWWLNDVGATVSAIKAAAGPFKCTGYRQSARYFANDAVLAARVRDVFKAAAPRAAADALWSEHVLPAARGRQATFVALYHRQGDEYSDPTNAYADCLPSSMFYAAALRWIRAKYDGPLVYVTSSHDFGEARRRALFPVLEERETLVAIDHQDPTVVLTALARCDAATFSFGTFSWWAAFLSNGPVLYDARLRDAGALGNTSCASVLRRGLAFDQLERFASEHIPRAWTPVGSTRVAVLLSGHVRNTFTTDANLSPLADFLALCAAAVDACDVFAHAWRDTEPTTPTYHTAAPGRPIDDANLLAALQPVRYELAAQPPALNEGMWGTSPMSRAGVRFSFAAMRAALHLAESHAAQHGAYDVYIRARYDMYRLREGAMVPARVVTCCFRNVHARSLYWFDSSPAGVLRGVASRGGGDNFFWGTPGAYRDVVARIHDEFDETTRECFAAFGDQHPENLLQQAARTVGVAVAGCGRDDGIGGCAASPGATPPLAPAASWPPQPPRLHFVNFAHGSAYENRQQCWARSAVARGGADAAKAWTLAELEADPLYEAALGHLVARLGAKAAAYRMNFALWKPLIILRELEKLRDGDWVAYSDVVRPYYLNSLHADKCFRASLWPLLAWLDRMMGAGSGAWLPGVYLDYRNRDFQPWFKNWPKNNFLARNASQTQRLLDAARLPPRLVNAVYSAHHLQNSWIVVRKSMATARLIREWFRLCASPESALTSIIDQSWYAILAVKYDLPAISGESLEGTPRDKHGHINPNALKDINVVLEALVGPNAGAIQLVTPNETRLGYTSST